MGDGVLNRISGWPLVLLTFVVVVGVGAGIYLDKSQTVPLLGFLCVFLGLQGINAMQNSKLSAVHGVADEALRTATKGYEAMSERIHTANGRIGDVARSHDGTMTDSLRASQELAQQLAGIARGQIEAHNQLYNKIDMAHKRIDMAFPPDKPKPSGKQR